MNFTILREDGCPLLGPLNLQVGPGEKVAMVGESGSGKSLLLSALMGALPQGVMKGTGTLRVMGLDPKQARSHGIYGRQITWVPQDPALVLHPHLSVRDCLTILPTPTRWPVILGWLEALDLPTHPGFLNAPVQHLSGGQKQRLAWIHALAGDPDFMLLDEPTASLDPATLTLLTDALIHQGKRRSFGWLWITHDLPLAAEQADRVVVLYGGRVVEQGAARRVLAQPRHAYTRRLLSAAAFEPSDEPGFLEAPEHRQAPCSYRLRCPAGCHQTPVWQGEPEDGVWCGTPITTLAEENLCPR